MSEIRKIEVIETSLAYVLGALAAVLAFMLSWFICVLATCHHF